MTFDFIQTSSLPKSTYSAVSDKGVIARAVVPARGCAAITIDGDSYAVYALGCRGAVLHKNGKPYSEIHPQLRFERGSRLLPAVRRTLQFSLEDETYEVREPLKKADRNADDIRLYKKDGIAGTLQREQQQGSTLARYACSAAEDVDCKAIMLFSIFVECRRIKLTTGGK